MELTLYQALKKGVEAHKAGEVQEADRYYTAILKANPKHPDANHNMGVMAVGVDKVEEALTFFKTALEVNPNIAQYWLSYINALIKLDRMADAKAVLDQAKSNGAKGDGFDQLEKSFGGTGKDIEVNVAPKKLQEPSEKQIQPLIDLYSQGQYQMALNKGSQLLDEFPNSINLYNIIGASKQCLGKLDEAVEAYNKALSIQPDYAEAYYNKGIVLQEQGKLEEAIEAYKKALSIKPDYAKAYVNMGVTLKANGKPEIAIDAYKKVLSIKPDFAIAHQLLSTIKEYTTEDEQFLQVQELYRREDLNEDERCKLSFALAKMYEDIGKLDQAFHYLSMGNAFQKKSQNYSIEQEEKLFKMLKMTQPLLLKNSLDVKKESNRLNPIFILGMPRSGTTLIEQIISSHSKVTGAGELNHVSQFGANLALNPKDLTQAAVSEFKDKYLSELLKVSNGKQLVTDKMPHNFHFIPLICAAFPEANIIHVQRNAAATCWSNYKQYFSKKGLGYSYNLSDVVAYYHLYIRLMNFWQSKYDNRIYNLNYEKITTEQESETRKLIKHLGLNWENTCLSPHKNKRSITTASQLQVRQKVYQGSSEAWRKYEPLLNGAFDTLPSS